MLSIVQYKQGRPPPARTRSGISSTQERRRTLAIEYTSRTADSIEDMQTNLFQISINQEKRKNVSKYNICIQSSCGFDFSPYQNMIVQSFINHNRDFVQTYVQAFQLGEMYFYTTIDFLSYEIYQQLVELKFGEDVHQFFVGLHKDEQFVDSDYEKNCHILKMFFDVSFKNHFVKDSTHSFFYDNEEHKDNIYVFSFDVLKNQDQTTALLLNFKKMKRSIYDGELQDAGPNNLHTPAMYQKVVETFKSELEEIGLQISNTPMVWKNSSVPVSRRYKFVHKSKEIDWAFFSVDRSISAKEMEKFVNNLIHHGECMNVFLNKPAIVHTVDCSQKHLANNFIRNVAECLPNIKILILGVASCEGQESGHVYETVKAISECNYGIVTQFFTFPKFKDADQEHFQNLLWKINTKAGGCNVHFPIDKSYFDQRQILVIGIHTVKTRTAIVSIFGKNFKQIFSTCSTSITEGLIKHVKNATEKLPNTLEHVLIYSLDKNLASARDLFQMEPALEPFCLMWTVVKVYPDSEFQFFDTTQSSKLQKPPTFMKFPPGLCFQNEFDPDTFHLSSVERNNASGIVQYKVLSNGFQNCGIRDLLQQFTLALCRHSARFTHPNFVPVVLDYSSRIFDRHTIYKAYANCNLEENSLPTIHPNLQDKHFFC